MSTLAQYVADRPLHNFRYTIAGSAQVFTPIVQYHCCAIPPQRGHGIGLFLSFQDVRLFGCWFDRLRVLCHCHIAVPVEMNDTPPTACKKLIRSAPAQTAFEYKSVLCRDAY